MKSWGKWRACMEAREPAEGLALFRIAVGLCVLSALLSVLVPHLEPVIWHDASDGGYLDLARGPWLVDLLGGPAKATVHGLLGAALLGAALLVLGLGGRVTAFLTLQAFQAVTDLNPQAGGSYDYLLDNALWLIVLGGGTQTLSLDARLRAGTWRPEATVGSWSRWLVLYQLVLVYWSTGLHKVSAHWTPAGGFSALYYTLQQPSWHRFDMTWLAHVYPLTQAATAGTWVFELTSPILLWILWMHGRPREASAWAQRVHRAHLRRVWVSCGISLHMGIFLLMEVGPFTWITLAYYLPILRGEEWNSIVDLWQQRLSGSRLGKSRVQLG
jgi:hypothetical protein